MNQTEKIHYIQQTEAPAEPVKNVLVLENICKTFTGHKAVDDVSFSIPQGSIFGLLGPNGAGKTTLIRIFTNILAADTGRVFIEGEPLNKDHRKIIGYMPEERGLYKKMKVGEHLVYLARLKNLSAKDAKEKIHHWMEKFGIENWWNKKVEELSKGMQQKVQFIATVIHEPRIIILDEPFSGLDPVNTNLIKQEIYGLRERGATIIFSTHRMEKVEEICEKIVMINRGQKVLEGKVEDVREQFKEHKFIIKFIGHFPSHCPDFEILELTPGRVVLRLMEGISNNTLLNFLIHHNVEILSFKELLPSINDVFILKVTEKHHA